MARLICLEMDKTEVFVNLDQICQANITTEAAQVQYSDGRLETFTGGAAHTLIQALRHEERRTAQQN